MALPAGTQFICGIGVSPDGAVYVEGSGIGEVLLKGLGAEVTGVTAETIVMQTLLPVGFLKQYSAIEIYGLFTKSGVTDAGTFNIYCGTAGTVADALIYTGSLAVANRNFGPINFLKLLTNTSLVKVGAGSTVIGSVTVGNANTQAAAVAISDASANALYITVTILRTSGSTDTVGIAAGYIKYRNAM